MRQLEVSRIFPLNLYLSVASNRILLNRRVLISAAPQDLDRIKQILIKTVLVLAKFGSSKVLVD